jgi:deoxyribodipyrimidine photo-lyase
MLPGASVREGDPVPPAPSILWLRRDLRLRDNPALRAAAGRGAPVLPVFFPAAETEADPPLGAAGRWWLAASLRALHESLAERGSRLLIRADVPEEALPRLAAEVGASHVYWNRVYEPAWLARDRRLQERLAADGVVAQLFPGNLLFEPWSVRNKSGGPYRVFTPFWRACCERYAPLTAVPGLESVPAPAAWPGGEAWRAPLPEGAACGEHWQPGEEGAEARLARFLSVKLSPYPDARERPDRAGTSSLSPHLHWGEVSVRRVYEAVAAADAPSESVAAFRRQLGWREFAHHVLYAHPETPREPLDRRFQRFPWRYDEERLAAWREGRTGYPLVDAAMRALRRTGWMHNRLRMVTASFLTKDLRLDWRQGAAWFAARLVDADLANNTLGWQWAAGCGADAAPYFRIFNPVTQAQRFDPDGEYARTWVPELAALPPRRLPAPWTATADELRTAGVTPGETYPRPVVEHARARREALAALDEMKTA